MSITSSGYIRVIDPRDGSVHSQHREDKEALEPAQAGETSMTVAAELLRSLA